TDLRGERVGNIVAVQIERRDDVVVFRLQQDLLQEVVGDNVLDDDLAAALRITDAAPRPFVYHLRAKLALRELVSPGAERAFRVLHDVAFMYQRHGATIIGYGILQGFTNQTLRPFPGDGLDADRRGLRKADLLHAHFVHQEVDNLLHLRRLRRPLDTGVNVLRVLAEDHHIGLLGILHRRGRARKITDRAHAGVEVELLTYRHVQRAHAPADGRRQRPFNGDDIALQRVERFTRQPFVVAVGFQRLFAGIDFHPHNPALTAVGLLHGRVHDIAHSRCDIDPDSVAFDEGNNRLIRNVQRVVGIDGNRLALGGHLDLLILHGRGVS